MKQYTVSLTIDLEEANIQADSPSDAAGQFWASIGERLDYYMGNDSELAITEVTEELA